MVFIVSAIVSLPVMIILIVVVEDIKDSQRQPVGKMKRLLLSCYKCTVPYALTTSYFFSGKYGDDNYKIHYVLYVLAISCVLFACSAVAISIAYKRIEKFFCILTPQINEMGQAEQKVSLE